MLSCQPPLWTVTNSRIRRTLRQPRRPDFRENGSPFSGRLSFWTRLLLSSSCETQSEIPPVQRTKLSALVRRRTGLPSSESLNRRCGSILPQQSGLKYGLHPSPVITLTFTPRPRRRHLGRAMRRGPATGNGRGGGPDAGTGMHDGVARVIGCLLAAAAISKTENARIRPCQPGSCLVRISQVRRLATCGGVDRSWQ
jgi:hypothetical protein